MKKYVYSFLEGDKTMRNLLGGKGANLAEMSRIGLPVPTGFTISSEACNQYFLNDNEFKASLAKQIDEALAKLESDTNKTFGGSPVLLVSVRSGAVVSMPGMMDTILNLGLNDRNVMAMGESFGSMSFALDCYRRFIQMYSNVVLEIPMHHFEKIIDAEKKNANIHLDQELTVDHLNHILDLYKELVESKTGEPFEQDPRKQLQGAVEAVFRSWNNERAQTYRKLNNIPDELGTAVNVQMMVFGNMNDQSGTGVVFTRNPSTGENNLYGEFLMNAQGEDVVAGIRTPLSISELANIDERVFDELLKSARLLEEHYKDMQDIEFTIENGKFYILQTRNGKRAASATVKIAVDLQKEGVMSKEDAVRQLDLSQIDSLLHPKFDDLKLAQARNIATGLPASPGAATGPICFDSETAERLKLEGNGAILVREETSPEDINGMVYANGVLTAKGGMTSHAAVVARGMGKCCVSGCGALEIDEVNHTLKVEGNLLKEGDYISIDGSTGNVYLGKVETTSAIISEDFRQVMDWADEFSRLVVLANADSPKDAKKAREFGAKGIGLCRTEHMFFDSDRIMNMREMIMAQNDDLRKQVLGKLYPHQKEDFKKIFDEMRGYPVNIRLLDPPLHEFLPSTEAEIKEMSDHLNVSFADIEKLSRELAEVNPMMGLRGCRLGVLFPSIYEMQVRAIIDAALEMKRESGFAPKPEIMIPLVGNEEELKNLRLLAQRIVDEQDVGHELGQIKIGTMIEVPRACVVADQIAQQADYFSFGTNDLTQLTLGYSRDDAGTFIKKYLERGILDSDPFQKIDSDGVGELMKMAIAKGKSINPNLKIGVCGEQGGDADSVAFFNTLDLDYISCSPYRIPKARIAAAQSALNH